MRKVNLIGISFVVLLLAGCSTAEMAEVNKKISDFSAGLVSVGNGEDDSNGTRIYGSGNVYLTEKKTIEYSIPVNIDTAAVRLKKHFNILATDEVEQIKKKNSLSAQAISENGNEWYAQPGIHYKLGKGGFGTGGHNRLQIELTRENGRTLMALTYRSPSKEIHTDPNVLSLFAEAKSVAEGKTR